jgi:hypothetical protein
MVKVVYAVYAEAIDYNDEYYYATNGVEAHAKLYAKREDAEAVARQSNLAFAKEVLSDPHAWGGGEGLRGFVERFDEEGGKGLYRKMFGGEPPDNWQELLLEDERKLEAFFMNFTDYAFVADHIRGLSYVEEMEVKS